MRTRFDSQQVLSIVVIVSLLIAAPTMALAADSFAKIGTFRAQWEKLARSPRSEALGGSDMAVASGPLATLSNTAPLPDGHGIGIGYGRFEAYAGDTIDYLGTAFDYGSWRLSAVGARMVMDPMLVRTAYNPEGTGETFDAGFKFVQLNASLDLAGLSGAMAPEFSPLRWVAGIGYRHRFMELAEVSVDAWNVDLGTSASLTRRTQSGWLQISGSAHLRNVTERNIVYDERESRLPHVREFGLAATIIQDLADREGNELQFRALLSTRKDLVYGDSRFFGDHRIGFELTLFEILALRSGRDEARYIERDTSYGLGLILPEKWTGSFLVSYDYARVSIDDSRGSTFTNRDLHALNLRYFF
jgi:hypothetical protein